MDYPVTQAIIDHLLAGLRQNEARLDGIEARIAKAIEKLPADRQAAISIETVFASSTSPIKLAGELAVMARNPAFKSEPAISQLRRAEAAFIEAHDAYLKQRTAIGYAEMNWASQRLTVARAGYDGFVASLPVTKRTSTAARAVVSKAAAIEAIRLDAFSVEEQQAIRLVYTDRARAIASIDRIIVDGGASRHLRLLHAYLIDPARNAEIEQWLAHEIGGLAQTSPVQVPADAPIFATSGTAVITTDPVDNTAFDRGAHEALDDIAIDTLEGWLHRHPGLIAKFAYVERSWQFESQIKVPQYASAYKQVARHPRFQALIARLKSAAC